jgi:transposase
MEAVYERCCGLDVHKRMVVACLVTSGPGQGAKKETRTFASTTADLLALGDWLDSCGCTHVAMESTGSFWKPIYNVLEDRFSLILVNTRFLKLIPGRKTDVKDAEWISDLLRHGLLRASFIPSRPQRELRELSRYRTSLVRERSSEVNRVQKVLEGANIKLASVATNILGNSGRAMLAAIVEGISDPKALADLAQGHLRKKKAALEDALNGLIHSHQRLLLRLQLRHIVELDQLIEEVSSEIDMRMQPFQEALDLLQSIPGVGKRTAETILSEVGVDVERFPSARHLASWSGLCPGLNESAGKNSSGRTPKGSVWLKAALIQSAHAAARTRTTYLASQYRRLAARIGAKKAAVAVAHTLLVIAFRLLRDRTPYRDIDPDQFSDRNRERSSRRLAHRLEQLGYRVSLEPIIA